MSRPLAGKVYADARLLLEEPLHVGALGDELECDMPLQRDGRGRIFIPGASLAGALRAWSYRRFPDSHDLLDGFWGYQYDRTDAGAASFCLVNDAVIEDGAALEEIVHRVRLDAHTATASEGGKFDQAVLARGQRLSLSLELEIPAEEERAKDYRALLGWIMRDLQGGLVRLGAGKQHGLGRVRAEQIEIREHTFDLNGFRARAQARCQHPKAPIARAGAAVEADAESDPLDKNRLAPKVKETEEVSLVIKWRPVGALMSKAPFDSNTIDILPLIAHADKTNVALALPGTGIRGALRHTVSRIVRTLLDIDEAPAVSAFSGGGLTLPGIEALFGSASDTAQTDSGEGEARGRTSALRTPGLLAENARFNIAAWDKITETKAEVIECKPKKDKKPVEFKEYVKLRGYIQAATKEAHEQAKDTALQLRPEFRRIQDRWSAITANLFQELQPLAVRWPPLCFTLELDRLSAEERDIAVALLLLAVSEMRAGRFTLGFGANQSFGTLAIDDVQWETPNGSDWAWLNDLAIEEEAITVKKEARAAADAQARLDTLRAGFSKWAAEQRENRPDKQQQEGVAT